LTAGATHDPADAVWSRAGVEIRLEPGWHTYWRYPGDSGVPPTFDFSGSENVKSVSVLWPAPTIFADGAGGNSIGYAGHVVFPLRIIALDATKLVSLHLKVGYGICRNVCIPAEANLALVLSGNAGADEPTLAAAEARVPRRVPLGARAGLAIGSVHREPGDGRDRITVDVMAPEGISVDLLVEGQTPDWALPLPRSITPAPGSASGVRRFAFDLDGLPPGTQAQNAVLTFTAISPDDAIEVVAHPD
jgi:DsbC/DsbD-like thiol-disulfide interchange protein